MVLDARTTLTARFGWRRRGIELQQGRMQLQVAPSPRPMRVQAGNSVLRDIGTTFQVELLDDGRIDIALLDGALEIDSHGTQGMHAALRPGQQLQVLPLGPDRAGPPASAATGRSLATGAAAVRRHAVAGGDRADEPLHHHAAGHRRSGTGAAGRERQRSPPATRLRCCPRWNWAGRSPHARAPTVRSSCAASAEPRNGHADRPPAPDPVVPGVAGRVAGHGRAGRQDGGLPGRARPTGTGPARMVATGRHPAVVRRPRTGRAGQRRRQRHAAARGRTGTPAAGTAGQAGALARRESSPYAASRHRPAPPPDPPLRLRPRPRQR
ncbi:MAG: FecR family protein [Stenotrophomonas sp.]